MIKSKNKNKHKHQNQNQNHNQKQNPKQMLFPSILCKDFTIAGRYATTLPGSLTTSTYTLNTRTDSPHARSIHAPPRTPTHSTYRVHTQTHGYKRASATTRSAAAARRPCAISSA